MNTKLKQKTNNHGKYIPRIYGIDEESYAQLDYTYWWVLALSGILFMAAAHKLGWFSGIGWLFLCRFISMLLVRFDISRNTNIFLWYEKKDSHNTSTFLN